MEGFRFVHTADLHLDCPFTGMGQVSAELQEKLREATYRSFQQIVNMCIREKVDFLTIGGDIYDGANPSLRAQIRFRNELLRLADSGISSFVIHGNHDHLKGERVELSWPEGVHIFSDHQVEEIPVVRQGKEIARIYGISYPYAEVKENLAKRFKRGEGAPYAIALLHTNVGSVTDYANYAPCTLGDLTMAGFDFWGLGHIHKRTVLHEDKPVIIYPGNPQGRHPNENGPKGCYLVEVDEHGQTTYTFQETDVIRWITQEIAIDKIVKEEDLFYELLKQQENLYRQNPGRILFVRMILTGKAPLHAYVRKEETLSDLLLTLRENSPGNDESQVFCESIQNKTRPVIDRELYRHEPSLLGDVLALADSYRTDEKRRVYLREALQPLFGAPSARQVVEPPTDEELLSWLTEAENILLELLGKGGS